MHACGGENISSWCPYQAPSILMLYHELAALIASLISRYLLWAGKDQLKQTPVSISLPEIGSKLVRDRNWTDYAESISKASLKKRRYGLSVHMHYFRSLLIIPPSKQKNESKQPDLCLCLMFASRSPFESHEAHIDVHTLGCLPQDWLISHYALLPLD